MESRESQGLYNDPNQENCGRRDTGGSRGAGRGRNRHRPSRFHQKYNNYNKQTQGQDQTGDSINDVHHSSVTNLLNQANEPATHESTSQTQTAGVNPSSRQYKHRLRAAQFQEGPGRGRRQFTRIEENSNISEPSEEEPSRSRQSQSSSRARGRGGRRATNNNYIYRRNNSIALDQPNDSQRSCGESGHEIRQEEALNVQSEISENQLRANNFECMICCDNISRYQPIWCCASCYNIFHLKCAVEWCNKSIKSRNEAIASSQYPSLGLSDNNNAPGQSRNILEASRLPGYEQERVNSIEWPCPACRDILHTKPDKYKCFCGKTTRPEVNKHLVPHSCGQLCGRKRPNSDCPHTCNQICHPGRCAPCPLSSKKPCFCGKLIREIKCSSQVTSCDQECGKLLDCGTHQCSNLCHSGDCGPCQEVLTLSCHCNAKQVTKVCSDLCKGSKKPTTRFSCDKVCGKLLDCGKHYCNEKCHSYPCRSCPLLSENIKTCPCGSNLLKKSQLSKRTSCTDPVPCCDNKCNRPLICGPEKNHHKCQKKCHFGPCAQCKLKMTAYCECRLSTKTVDCSVMYRKLVDGDKVTYVPGKFTFRCEARCNRPKDCGRHRCNNKCCDYLKSQDSQLHRCDQICNKKLACNVHTCPERCHPGQCGDCTNIGWTELTCHCGGSVLYPPIPCGARAPACHRPCRRAHSCGHQVKHECHDDSEKCAPCTVFVKKSCFCGVDSKDSVYCYLAGYSCGRTCKKVLSCRQHQCKRVCHDGDCETPNNRGLILCNQPCPVPRFPCKHPCNLPCHGKTPCPSTECKRTIEINCECGNKVERIECNKLTRDSDNKNKVAMMSTYRSGNQDSVIIDLSQNKPSQSAEENRASKRQLDCDETCSILKRNKALAEALDIAQPDLKPTAIFGEDPLRLLKEAIAQDYKFAAATYASLVKLVKSAKESEKRFIFMQFPPAERLRREVVHELAHHFNCTSESREDEPFRHVVVKAHKNKSCVPEFSIEQLLPVTD